MAISFVQIVSGSANNGGNVTLNFSGQASGDFVIVFGGHNSTSANAGVSTAGYTEQFDFITTNRFSCSYKFITSDTSVTCIGSTQSSDEVAYVALIFRGVDTSTPIDNSHASATGTGEPNSPSLTTLTDGAAVLSAFLLNEARGLVAGPSGYNNATTVNGSDSNPVTAGAAWKIKTPVGAENPGPWDLTSIPSGDGRAVTIALRPAVPGVNQDGVLSSTGTGTASFVGVYDALGPMTSLLLATVAFKGSAIRSSPASLTGTGTATWTGTSLSQNPAPFTMTGRGTAAFVGAISQAGGLSITGTVVPDFSGGSINDVRFTQSGTWSVSFVGGVSHMTSVREVIESRGAATVGVS